MFLCYCLVYVLSVCVQSSEQEGLQSHVEENAVLQQQIHAKDRELTLKVCICMYNVGTDLLHVQSLCRKNSCKLKTEN